MKVHITADRDFEDFNTLCDAVKKSGFKIKEIVSGGNKKGCDVLAEEWANNNKVKVKKILAEWNNLDAEDVDIQINNWGKQYNAKAGKTRDKKIIEYVDGIISIGPSYILNDAKNKDIKLFTYDQRSEKNDEEFLYVFGSEL